MAKMSMSWSTLKRWQKLTILIAACGIYALLVFVVIFEYAPSFYSYYSVLYSGLETDDQEAIVAYLKENKVSYKLELMDESNVILVHDNKVHKVRLALAQAGLPKSGTLFNMNTEKPKKNYLRVIEGELSRTLERIENVELARVNISLPERLFHKKKKSSVAVLLKLKSGVQITPKQVKAVNLIVSKGVHGVLPENISVVDTFGNVLSDMAADDIGEDIVQQREFERQREKEFEAKVRTVLEPIFGMGKIVVGVNIDLDFNNETSIFREYIPNDNNRGAPRSIMYPEETLNDTGAPETSPGVTPGAISSITLTPGSIKRINACVLINGELEERRINDVKTLVAAAVGLNESRGDTLVVQSWTFRTNSMDDARARDKLISLVAMIVTGFAIFLSGSIYAFLRWKRRKAMLAMNEEAENISNEDSREFKLP
jgi:flagellar M-ring protein FliF